MNDRLSSPASSPEELSPGRMLRQMRKAAGEDIATLSRALKVPERKLKALEADNHEVFSDVVLMRGIAASVCRHFRSDPAPVLALLPDFAPTRLITDADLNESFQDNQQPRFTRDSDTRRRFTLGPVGIIVGLLLLAAAAVAFLPPWSGDYFGSSASSPTPQAQPDTTTPSTVSTVVEPVLTAPIGVPTTEAVEPQPAVTPPPPDAAPVPPQETAPVTTPTPVTEPPAVPQTSAAPTATLLLRANATSWVQIRNAEGVSLVQRLLQAGESVTAPGQPPWSVVVGNAADTEVLVRGAPLDISQKAREGVARFEVK